MIAYLFSFIWYIDRSYFGQEWLLSSNFCKACPNCLHPSHSTQSSADALIVAVLWKLPQMRHSAQITPTWTKPIWTCFYKIYCCAAIHGRIWMNNIPNQSSLIMLSCTEIRFVISFFFSILRNLESNSGFHLRNSIKLLTQTLEKGDFDMFYKTLLLNSHLLSNMHDQVSYERELIVLSFPDTSFVILLFVFQRFDMKSVFPFFIFF